ncbi:MAG: GTP 3',8-cyclase MoaA [Rhodocyclaceae bacterium]|nr:GTP 3',8-cyclase MoaA [Rhodocyclaceae bacterium]
MPSTDSNFPLPVLSVNGLPSAPTGDPSSSAGLPVDTRGRRIRDLRISVIDRCNFRCTYCMPKSVFGQNYLYLPRAELLSFEEIIRVARQFVALGVEKIRLTGGEPLLRRNLERLIAELAKLPVELTLTTNGSLLASKGQALKDAGLHRVTVSLDGLDDAVFRRMNDVDFPVADVLAGIDAASRAGFTEVKVNCVVKRGTNDSQILPLALHFRGSGHIVRFIEYMDVGSSNGWQMDEVVPSADIIARIHQEFPLEAIDANYPGEVAARWRYLDGQGEIGVISSVTQAFCSSCTRARLSTEGQLYTCLFAERGHDLRVLLRGGADDQQLQTAIAEVWTARGDRYSEIRTDATTKAAKIEMSYIGG